MKIHVQVIPISSPDEIPDGPDPPAVLFHYTTGTKLKQIINSGIIRPSTAQVPPHEKPVVWCSASGTWEPTATKCPIPGKIGQLITAKAQSGLVRISLPATCAGAGASSGFVACAALRHCAGAIAAATRGA